MRFESLKMYFLIFSLRESNRKDFALGIYWLGARYNGPVGRSINWKPIRTTERQGAGKRLQQ